MSASRSVTSAPPPAEKHSTPLRWEDWFLAAPAAQQEEILQLARQQGLVYFHQLPPVNGTSKGRTAAPRTETVLDKLLAGTAGTLPAYASRHDCVDLDLDEVQREAVSRALSTPDVFLLEGLPGSGKTRVAAQILLDAAKAGQRVLFVATRAVTLDAALSHLVAKPEAFVLRYLAADETASRLPAALQPFTLSHRQQAFNEQTKRAAEQLLAQANGVAVKDDGSTWIRLSEVVKQAAELAEACACQEKRQAEIEVQVRDRARSHEGPLRNALLALDAARDKKRTEMPALKDGAQKELVEVQGRLRELEATLLPLRPLAEAKRRGRWWTWSWWKALFKGDVVGKVSRLEAEQTELKKKTDEVQQKLAALASQEEKDAAEYEAACSALLNGEIETRRAAHLQEVGGLQTQKVEIVAAWKAACDLLDETARPTDMTEDALRTAREVWSARKNKDEEKRQFSLQWAGYLQTSGKEFAQRLPELANVSAVPLEGLTDQHSGFDLLVLEDAHLLTEADILRLGRTASRYVLIADHQPDAARKEPSSRLPEPALRSRGFQKLWRLLHQDRGSTTYTWSRPAGGLCCQLRPLTRDEETRLEVEHLADHPDIELRILPQPRPTLAQIAFPPTASLADAKTFIQRELQEVPIARAGGAAWVRELAGHFVCTLSGLDAVCSVEIEPGLKEWACESHTCRLEFSKAAGWSRDRVEGWLDSHFGLRDQGRTLSLHRCHRARGSMAALWSDLLFTDSHHPAAEYDGASLIFCPVPPPQRENGKKGLPATPVAWPKEGAGLEIDLTAIRTVDRIPSDLRAKLPRKGYANYFEAQAVVRYLEKHLASGNGEGPALHADDLAVMALYEGQVELIKKLLERSEPLKGLKLRVGLPDSFSQQEFGTIALSITRSHSHRAVALGEHPSHLLTALTRARSRILLFADPGNLIKRGGWHGPLEHLDAATASVEGQRISQLARYLQNQGTYQAAFRVELP